jgi:Ca-activated chloride channel family protein
MNFNQWNNWPFVLIGFLFLTFIVLTGEKNFFKKIKTYWFYDRSFLSKLSSFFYFLGFLLLLFSLLDLRGPEEKIEAKVNETKTIILLDTSASMLAEDVGPSRLQKAILIAKHFARKAPGHQISVVAFAEIQKKIIPFTNDIDLIDARLESLKTLRNHYGSSALTQAIQESIQYLKESGGEAEGNILVLTDGEETAEEMNLNVPNSIRVAFVGVGSEQGGRIPLDDARGLRFGYKKNNGIEVITKLNENFFKVVTKDIPISRYWIANTYSLPSEEIVNFFQSEKLKAIGSQLMTIKPVFMHWLVIPGLLLLLFSMILKRIKIFVLGLSFFLFQSSELIAESNEKEIPKEIASEIQALSRGELSTEQKVKLADKLYKAGIKDEALTLFNENLGTEKIDSKLPAEAYLNYGTALLESGDLKKGLKEYDKILKQLDDNKEKEKIQRIISQNISTYFQQQKQKKEQQQKKNQEDKKDQESKDSENQENQNSSGNSSDKNKEEKETSKSDQEKKDKNEDEDQKKDQKDKKSEDKEDKQDKSDQPEKEQNNINEEQEKTNKPKKLPAKLKQLMSDDRQIQMKIIENGTRDLNKKKSRKSKDW